jgi:hypothetical protein
MTGEAFSMQIQLARLARQYNVATEPRRIPLLDPIDGEIIVQGLASTTDLDLDRVRFRRYACCHGKSRYHCSGNMNPAQVAGQIERLNYDDHVNLRIRSTVTHELAR